MNLLPLACSPYQKSLDHQENYLRGNIVNTADVTATMENSSRNQLCYRHQR